VIRVNLLAQKRETRSAEGDQRWVGVLIGVLAVETVVLFLVFQSKRDELSAQVRTNAEIKSQIDQIKKATSNQADIKAQLEALRARREAIEKLQSARTGPTAMLLELGQLLTPGRGPTADPDMLAQLRRDNPSSMFNTAWDSRRLWLTSLAENDRLLRLEGLARDGDDVSELARRLGLSIYFGEVRLLPGTRTTEGGEGKVELIKFQLQAKVRY
jgi:type IV pilus assembly protein PilN